MQIMLTPDQEAIIKSWSKLVMTEKGDRYLYQPFYFKDCGGDGVYEYLRFDQLPEEVKDLLLANQGIKLPAE